MSFINTSVNCIFNSLFQQVSTLTVSELDFGLSRENVNIEVSAPVLHASIGLMKNALLDYFFGHVASLVKEMYKEILVDLFQ